MIKKRGQSLCGCLVLSRTASIMGEQRTFYVWFRFSPELVCLEINVWFYYSTSVQSYLNKGLLVESHQPWDSQFDSTNLIVLIFLLNLVEMHPDPKQVDQTILISQIMSQMLTQASSYYILDSIFYTEIIFTLINHISTLIQHIWLVLHNYSVSLKAMLSTWVGDALGWESIPLCMSSHYLLSYNIKGRDTCERGVHMGKIIFLPGEIHGGVLHKSWLSNQFSFVHGKNRNISGNNTHLLIVCSGGFALLTYQSIQNS